MKRLPIRVRLTLWYLVVFALALVAFGASAWMLVRQRLYSEVGEQLQTRVAGVQRFMQAQRPGISTDRMRSELEDEYETEDQAVWLQIIDQDGKWMFRAHGTPEVFPTATAPQTLPARGRAWTARAGHERLRVIEKPISVDGRLYTVQAAVVTNGVHHTLENLQTVFFILAPGILLIAAIGSYFMSRRALATVDEITVMARSIHDRNLDSRLPALNTNDELQRLSDTLNEMLSRIEASFKRTRQFTADASHELRTPLSLIRTEAELALRKSRTEDEYRNALTLILAESERTTELIESLLTLARTDSGAEVVQLHSLECIGFLRQCANDWKAMFAESRQRFEVALPGHEVVVYADEGMLRRLMILLLDNARKYTPEGGRVTLQADATSRCLTIAVEDTGVGIAPEDLPKIFDRFYRVDKARSRSMGGAGLGLSLAKWIAAQHRTAITVESAPGKGSRFTFQLERASSEAPQASKNSPQAEEVV